MGEKGNQYRKGYELGLKSGYAKAREEEDYWRKRYDEALSWLRRHNFNWVADQLRVDVEEAVEVAEIETVELPVDQPEPAPKPKRKDGVRELETDEARIFELMEW